MIDLHTHILPGLDDGPEDLAGTKSLAAAFLAAGVERVVATPHVNHQWGPQMPTANVSLRETEQALEAAGLDLRLELGGEVSLSTALELEPRLLSRYRLAGGEWLLLEPPFQGSSVFVRSMIFNVMTQGHRVLLAHPERCQTFQDDPQLLAGLIEDGARVQVTAKSLTGRFGQTALRATREMFRRDLVHVVASDAHHATERPPGMASELEQAGHEDLIRYLCRDMPAWILDGGEEPARPDVRGKKKAGRGILGRLGFNS